jgi:hypothetical protein
MIRKTGRLTVGRNIRLDSTRIEGVRRNRAEYNGVQLEIRIVPVECPIEEDDSVSDTDL